MCPHLSDSGTESQALELTQSEGLGQVATLYLKLTATTVPGGGQDVPVFQMRTPEAERQ